MKNKVLIIAEAGVNHNGDLKLAKKLIDVAAYSGADYVKFQTFKTKDLVIKSAPKADYQKSNSKNSTESQLSMLKKLELSEEDHYELIAYCRKKNIMFLSTGFDLKSIKFLENLNLNLFKIPSGEITNLPYLRAIGLQKKPIILSTGMADLKEINDAIKVLMDVGVEKGDITLLHCTSEYPTPMGDVNLNAMLTIKDFFGVNVGYSDHTLGIEIPIAAVAMGASVIEKHFTLDKMMDGPDHKASLEPNELKSMIDAIRNIERAIGNGIKEPSPSEKKNKLVIRKSIVAKTAIKKGAFFSEDNLTVKRPGNGISPMLWDQYVGTKATRDYIKDDLI